MSFLFPKQKVNVPDPAPAPTAPTTEDAAAAAEMQARDLRKRRGAAATVLTSAQGDTSDPATATKALLGS